MGDVLLHETFSAFYIVATSKGVRVAEVWDPLGEVGGGGERAGIPPFLRHFNDYELEMVNRFTCILV